MLTALLALSFLMIVHEFGHYLFARLAGMHVDRFSVFGIGPVILRLFEYKGCEFVISAIPFGAYVHIVGMESEDPETEGEASPPTPSPEGYKNFRDSSIPARIAAIAGGPLANYIAAMILAVGLFASFGMKQVVGTEVTSFSENSPAQAAGLQVGDELLSVAGESIPGEDAVDHVIEATASRLGQNIDIQVRRGEDTLTIPVQLNESAPALGAALAARADFVDVEFGTAVYEGIAWPFRKSAQILGDLARVITGQTEAQLSGPLGIMQVIAANSNDVFALFFTVAVISVALGLFNLLPLPALDGGRLLFIFIEAIARRPVNRKIEEMVHAVGMIALLLLIGYVSIGDVQRFSDDDEDANQDNVESKEDAKSPEAPAAEPAANE